MLRAGGLSCLRLLERVESLPECRDERAALISTRSIKEAQDPHGCVTLVAHSQSGKPDGVLTVKHASCKVPCARTRAACGACIW